MSRSTAWRRSKQKLNEDMRIGLNGTRYKKEHAMPAEARVASGDAFGFDERLRPAPQRGKRIVTNGVTENGNQGMRCELGELSGRLVRSRSQRQGNLFGTDATNTLRRAESGLVALTEKNPLGDTRLDIGFNPLVNYVDHLSPEVGQVVEASQLKRLERSLRASRKVVEHGLRSFHVQPAVFAEAGPREVADA